MGAPDMTTTAIDFNRPATAIIDQINDQAVALVIEVNQGRDLTGRQFVAAVLRTTDALITETFEKLDAENPELAVRLRTAFLREMVASGEAPA